MRSTKLYARIKRSSKYAHQNPAGRDPFPVSLGGGYGEYMVSGSASGSANWYRLSDVKFFFYCSMRKRFVPLVPDLSRSRPRQPEESNDPDSE